MIDARILQKTSNLAQAIDTALVRATPEQRKVIVNMLALAVDAMRRLPGKSLDVREIVRCAEDVVTAARMVATELDAGGPAP